MLPGLLRVADKRLLRFLTCGSVDDGKSTLIGHLPHDGGLLRDDELAALAADGARFETTGAYLDVAQLLDGLARASAVDERAADAAGALLMQIATAAMPVQVTELAHVYRHRVAACHGHEICA